MIDENEFTKLAVSVTLKNVEAITDKIGLFFLERASGNTANVKILKRTEVIEWLYKHIEEWPPQTFRIVIVGITPVMEIIGMAETDKPFLNLTGNASTLVN